MKMLATILIVFVTASCSAQDSVQAKVTHTAEKTVRYKINGYKFISYDCKCDLKRGDVFMIPKSRFDSLLKEAKPVRKRDL
jgi:hypothetical protein